MHKLIRYLIFLFFFTILLFLKYGTAFPQLSYEKFYDKEVYIPTGKLGISITNYGLLSSRWGRYSFEYPYGTGENNLYRASLWIGAISIDGDTLVSSGEGNTTTGCSEWHNIKGDSIEIFIEKDSLKTSYSYLQFTDNLTLTGHIPIGINVYQRTYHKGRSPFIIISYTLEKESDFRDISGLYSGIIFDFDISKNGDYDKISYDENYGFIYFYSEHVPNRFIGIKMLSEGPTSQRIWKKGKDSLNDIKKYLLLSSGKIDKGINETADFRILLSSGPYELRDNESIKLSLVLMAAPNLNALRGISIAAGNFFNTLNDKMFKKELVKEEVNEVLEVPLEYKLFQNYPNPFNRYTEISFSIPSDSEVDVVIYNIKGELVRKIASGYFSSGKYSFKWDGLNETKESVSSGIYLYVMNAKSFIKVNKMIYLK